MLRIFYGNDELKIQAEVQDFLESLRAESSDLVVERVESARYEFGLLANLLHGVSLFGDSPVYVLDTPSAVPEYEAELLSLASNLAESKIEFLVIEKTLLVSTKKVLTEQATTITEYKAGEVKRFDTFAMADALARKDKRTLWLLLQEAKQNNLAAEEIIGVLWWQLKMLRLVTLTKNATLARVKDFPYNKAKKALPNFKAGELEALALSLLTFYHQGHDGMRDIDLALEEWVLKL